MIKYTLKCEHDHSFESWFQSVQAYDKLAGAGHVACAVCGSDKVEKSLMAPKVRPARTAAVRGDADVGPPEGSPSQNRLSAPTSQQEAALAAMRKNVEENSDYVGAEFSKTARDMHFGTVPERAIYGTADLKQAKALIDDGVPVVPLPFMPKAKAN